MVTNDHQVKNQDGTLIINAPTGNCDVESADANQLDPEEDNNSIEQQYQLQQERSSKKKRSAEAEKKRTITPVKIQFCYQSPVLVSF
ncbi:hypothetical protein I4U23_011224 [Adineta vaga]|nr:hypothetical protein I4U23_011224 [Adineta vaga]